MFLTYFEYYLSFYNGHIIYNLTCYFINRRVMLKKCIYNNRRIISPYIKNILLSKSYTTFMSNVMFLIDNLLT